MSLRIKNSGTTFFGNSFTFVFLALLAAWSWSGQSQATAAPAGTISHPVVAARQGIDDQGRMQISNRDNCSICGMPVRKHLEYAAAIELNDGTTFYFCGIRCMLRGWLQPAIFLGVDKNKLKQAIVTDYFSGEPLNGDQAVFVSGSDITGPMGPTFIAVKNNSEAAAFIKRHGGEAHTGLMAITEKTWEKVTGGTIDK